MQPRCQPGRASYAPGSPPRAPPLPPAAAAPPAARVRVRRRPAPRRPPRRGRRSSSPAAPAAAAAAQPSTLQQKGPRSPHVPRPPLPQSPPARQGPRRTHPANDDIAAILRRTQPRCQLRRMCMRPRCQRYRDGAYRSTEGREVNLRAAEHRRDKLLHKLVRRRAAEHAAAPAACGHDGLPSEGQRRLLHIAQHRRLCSA